MGRIIALMSRHLYYKFSPLSFVVYSLGNMIYRATVGCVQPPSASISIALTDRVVAREGRPWQGMLLI